MTEYDFASVARNLAETILQYDMENESSIALETEAAIHILEALNGAFEAGQKTAFRCIGCNARRFEVRDVESGGGKYRVFHCLGCGMDSPLFVPCCRCGEPTPENPRNRNCAKCTAKVGWEDGAI